MPPELQKRMVRAISIAVSCFMDHKTDNRPLVRVSLEVALEPAVAFDLIVRELTDALARDGIEFEPGPNGKVVQNGFEVGRVSAWKPAEEIRMRWRAADWQPDQFSEVELRLEKFEGGTRIEIEHRG